MSKREIVAREIRRAMLDNPTDGGFNSRAAQREKIADQAADAILAALTARQDMVSTDLTDRLRAYAAKFGPIDPERAMCMEAAEEIERRRVAQQDVREALRDCIGFLKGDIAGPMQRDGIIKDAEAVLDRLEQGQ